MIHETCCCGNVLRQGGEHAFKMIRSPCRCPEPGPGRRTSPRDLSLDKVPRRQFEERRRLGLPLLSPIEQSLYRKEV